MNFKINSAWSALSVMLTLVALFLFLDRSKDAETLFRSGSSALNSIFGVLQGRTATVARR